LPLLNAFARIPVCGLIAHYNAPELPAGPDRIPLLTCAASGLSRPVRTCCATPGSVDQIVATLGLKEMTQGTLIRKLCTFTTPNPTRRAIFEFDKLIRSLYTLRYLRDPQLERNVHRSQNRIESYHQLRSAIAQVGGKKELTGRTDIEIEISNQCARLIANAIIYYNSAILSRLLTKYEASGNAKALALIKKMSPAAWRHIHLNGHYTFRGDGQVIDLDAIVAELELG
jgi:hypothetical protein